MNGQVSTVESHMQLNERVTRLETRADNQEEIMEDIGISLRELKTSVRNIETRLTRQGGFIAGLTFAFTMIGGALFAGLKLIAGKIIS